MEDPNFKLDFIYVLKGGIQVDLELDQMQRIKQRQYPNVKSPGAESPNPDGDPD